MRKSTISDQLRNWGRFAAEWFAAVSNLENLRLASIMAALWKL